MESYYHLSWKPRITFMRVQSFGALNTEWIVISFMQGHFPTYGYTVQHFGKKALMQWNKYANKTHFSAATGSGTDTRNEKKQTIHTQNNTTERKRRTIIHVNCTYPNTQTYSKWWTNIYRNHELEKYVDIRTLMFTLKICTYKHFFPMPLKSCWCTHKQPLTFTFWCTKTCHIWGPSIWNSLNLPYEVWEWMRRRQTQGNHTHILCAYTHPYLPSTPPPRFEAQRYVILVLDPQMEKAINIYVK